MPLKPTMLAALLWVAMPGTLYADAADTLQAGFRDPPAAARPRVWWHWMDGNVTQEGVRLDLQWMQRAGIGGVQNFDAALGLGGASTQTQVSEPLVYLTPRWQQALRYSVQQANQAGLEFTIAASPGFSATGGPWVQPAQAMKKLVWSETWMAGGKRFKGRLNSPPRTTGPFQNIPYWQNVPEDAHGQPAQYYADIATLAYPALAAESTPASVRLNITSSAGAIDAARLSDGDLAQAVSLPYGAGPRAWIQFSYARPQRVQAITTVIQRPTSFDPALESGPAGWLEASDDGRTFRRVAELPHGASFWSSALQQTAAFTPTVARIFRVVLERPTPSLFAQAGFAPDAPRSAHQIAELILHAAPRVHRFEDKAGFSSRPIVATDDTPAVAANEAIRRSGIIDLTGRVQPDGSLDWTPPPGHWAVLRFGYSLTGRTNHPASQAGTGLEVDKLNRGYVKKYMEAYLNEYEKTLGPELIGRRGLQYVLNDSYEAGAQNWTDDLLEQFRTRRGYDAVPWLPVLAGRVIESARASDRFSWDFRQTLGELIAEAHYGQISASLSERGLGRYGESHEHLRAFIGDGMQVKKTADIPMSAIWTVGPPVLGFSPETYDADVRESAAVAHIYGKRFVAAEAFSAVGAPYVYSAENLKPVADRAMAMGVNRFVIANSVHQPDTRPGPGLGLGPFGQWFTRKETWAGQAQVWTTYLARSSYLLQQGRFVADIAYLYGEDTNITALFSASAPAIPAGYNFDFINADAVLHELSVEDGTLFTRSGMRYRLLALDPSTQRMSLSLLRKLRDLVRDGAFVVGARPLATPSLADDEEEFRAIAEELWGERPGERAVGAGKVFADGSLHAALAALQIQPDVSFTGGANASMRFVHRELEEGDLYFVSSDTAHPQTLEATFRVGGKSPEVWRADDGTIEPASYRIENARTIVPLALDPHDALFVLFRRPTRIQTRTVPDAVEQVIADVSGGWRATFPWEGTGKTQDFAVLASWTENADPDIRYFSGTATYARTVTLARPARGIRLLIDLGKVKNVAELIVNGHSAGIAWKPPFRLDITPLVEPGANHLEVKLTNLWPNRLIGDKQPGAGEPRAWASFDPYTAVSPLLPSGLLGPVKILTKGPMP